MMFYLYSGLWLCAPFFPIEACLLVCITTVVCFLAALISTPSCSFALLLFCSSARNLITRSIPSKDTGVPCDAAETVSLMPSIANLRTLLAVIIALIIHSRHASQGIDCFVAPAVSLTKSYEIVTFLPQRVPSAPSSKEEGTRVRLSAPRIVPSLYSNLDRSLNLSSCKRKEGCCRPAPSLFLFHCPRHVRSFLFVRARPCSFHFCLFHITWISPFLNFSLFFSLLFFSVLLSSFLFFYLSSLFFIIDIAIGLLCRLLFAHQEKVDDLLSSFCYLSSPFCLFFFFLVFYP